MQNPREFSKGITNVIEQSELFIYEKFFFFMITTGA